MWLYPVPRLDELAEVYGEEYFFNKDFLSENKDEQIWGYVDYIAERINKQYDYQKLVQIAKNMLPPQERGAPVDGRRWLDVGCGLGYLLDVVFDEGFKVTGVEFNPSAVDYIRSKFTFEVRHGDINEIYFENKFDVISIIDVIEHLRDPFQVTKKLRELISDDGLLILGTMDSDSWVSRLLGKRLEDFRRIREHLFFFSRKSITDVLSDNGWEVVAIESFGHTFQLKLLLERVSLMFPLLGRLLKASVRPNWLLDANFYLNPQTKMLVFARPKKSK
jgi:2-polyprenyl-3-methyl-5-hydroxy-6-metoxy-1,4-benzoquinol methylase